MRDIEPRTPVDGDPPDHVAGVRDGQLQIAAPSRQDMARRDERVVTHDERCALAPVVVVVHDHVIDAGR